MRFGCVSMMDSPRAVSAFWTKEINEDKWLTKSEDGVGRPGSRCGGPGEAGKVESHGVGGGKECPALEAGLMSRFHAVKKPNASTAHGLNLGFIKVQGGDAQRASVPPVVRGANLCEPGDSAPHQDVLLLFSRELL